MNVYLRIVLTGIARLARVATVTLFSVSMLLAVTVVFLEALIGADSEYYTFPNALSRTSVLYLGISVVTFTIMYYLERKLGIEN